MNCAAKRSALIAAVLFAFAAGDRAIAQSGGSAVDSARQRYEKSGSDSNVKSFAHSMESDDPMERLKGIKSLTDLKSDQAVDLLLQALGDEDMRVRAKAIDACGDLRATAATPVLVQQLFMKDTAPEVKERILASLGKIGDARAAQPIIDFLGRDIDKSMRGTAIYALGDLGAPESLAALDRIARTDDDPTIQRLAREAASKVRYAQVQRENRADTPLNTFLEPQP
jgi:HEAT repeat protein